jgi:hypothetical protein
MKSLALHCSVAVLLVACGGADPDAATADETSSDRAQALAINSWTAVASEYQTFDVATTSTVRYGAGDAWVQMSVSGRAVCSNEFFGADPAFMVVKRCEVWNDAAPEPTPAPAPSPAPVPAPVPEPSPVPGPALPGPRASAAIMISGHSLTARGIFANMEAVAASQGTPMVWNTQIVNGSPTRFRTRGFDFNDPTFPGYGMGENRNGTNMNIAAELLYPQTIGGQRYDTLVLTERHDIVNTLLWEDTVRYTRHFHDRLVAGNSGANSYLYHSWLAINNKVDPSSWIGYERTVAKAWQCTAARVNVSLAAAGRGDRMTYLPAGLALTDLVEQAALRGAVAGVSGGDAAQTIDRLFTDSLHLSPLGEYYMALVSYASVYRRSPVGASAPYGVTAEQAYALQNQAWQSVSNYYNSQSVPGMEQCQAVMRDEVCSAYANYSGNWGVGAICSDRFSQPAQSNPFYFDAASDYGYWFP